MQQRTTTPAAGPPAASSSGKVGAVNTDAFSKPFGDAKFTPNPAHENLHLAERVNIFLRPTQRHKPSFPPALNFQQVVELNGYVIILVESRDGKIKLYGSPADKDNLEVADEILDVNERKLEDSPRAEVIKHIHECIQSCMIKLRVKRRSDSRLGNHSFLKM
uniref:PDZ domain-containing protein n=1 Tax=Anopheles culicifacies TaxID=139723 RepID=A0A182MUD0_9DIPT